MTTSFETWYCMVRRDLLQWSDSRFISSPGVSLSPRRLCEILQTLIFPQSLKAICSSCLVVPCALVSLVCDRALVAHTIYIYTGADKSSIAKCGSSQFLGYMWYSQSIYLHWDTRPIQDTVYRDSYKLREMIRSRVLRAVPIESPVVCTRSLHVDEYLSLLAHPNVAKSVWVWERVDDRGHI